MISAIMPVVIERVTRAGSAKMCQFRHTGSTGQQRAIAGIRGLSTITRPGSDQRGPESGPDMVKFPEQTRSVQNASGFAEARG